MKKKKTIVHVETIQFSSLFRAYNEITLNKDLNDFLLLLNIDYTQVLFVHIKPLHINFVFNVFMWYGCNTFVPV